MTVTIFALPKPFRGHDGVIQRNALESWARLGCEVVLLGRDEGVAEEAADRGFRHVPEIEATEQGTPRVDSIFATGESAASTELVCYVNADIILLEDFLHAAAALERGPARFLAVGRRHDADVTEPLDGSSVAFVDAVASHLRDAQLHPASGLDYFLYRRPLWPKIPPFAIGRTAWDNWLLWGARRAGAELVDATEAITALHQNHGYGHVAGGIDGAWKGVEARRNLVLAGGHSRLATLDDATARLDDRGRLVPLGRSAYRRRAPQRALSRAAFLVRRGLRRL